MNQTTHRRRESTLNLLCACSVLCRFPALLRLGNTPTLQVFGHQVCSAGPRPRRKTNANYIKHIPVLWSQTVCRLTSIASPFHAHTSNRRVVRRRLKRPLKGVTSRWRVRRRKHLSWCCDSHKYLQHCHVTWCMCKSKSEIWDVKKKWIKNKITLSTSIKCQNDKRVLCFPFGWLFRTENFSQRHYFDQCDAIQLGPFCITTVTKRQAQLRSPNSLLSWAKPSTRGLLDSSLGLTGT